MKTNYLGYLKYILEHKKNVFKTCWKRGLYLHAFTHDLSKFRPSEFVPYANNFYGEKDCKNCKSYMNCDYNQIGLGSGNFAKECKDYRYKKFDKAWDHHYKYNKHHWDHWIGKRMPHKYILQMICDWEAMALKFGDTAQQFYMNNYDKIDLTVESRCDLEFELGLIGGEALVSNITWKDYCNNIGISMEEDLIKLGYIK